MSRTKFSPPCCKVAWNYMQTPECGQRSTVSEKTAPLPNLYVLCVGCWKPLKDRILAFTRYSWTGARLLTQSPLLFTAIHASMEHAGILEHTRKVVMALYHNPAFVRDSYRNSHKQKAVDKAAHPLPLLFGSVLTHLFFDVEASYEAAYGKYLEFSTFPPLCGTSNMLMIPPVPRNNSTAFFIWSNTMAAIAACSSMGTNANTSASTSTLTSAYIIHPRARSRVVVDTAQDSTMIFHRCLYQTKLSNWGFISTRSPLAEKILNYRVSQAVSASKLLRPLLSHSSLSPSWKLAVYYYRSIILSILTYAMDCALLSPLQIQKMNTSTLSPFVEYSKSNHLSTTGS